MLIDRWMGRFDRRHLANHITGENLMDIDQSALKEMGIKRVGDRVRIGSQAKLFRHKEYQRKRNSNRVSRGTYRGALSLLCRIPLLHLTVKPISRHRRDHRNNIEQQEVWSA